MTSAPTLGVLLGGTSCDIRPPPAVPAGSSLCDVRPQHLRAAPVVTGHGWVPRTAAPHSGRGWLKDTREKEQRGVTPLWQGWGRWNGSKE